MAHTKRIRLPDGYMDCAVFGSGKMPLLILPGLGDGLKTVKGTSLPLSVLYRALGKHFRIYLCSRKVPLPVSCSTRDLARDQKAALDALGIRKAHVLGVSQGGMVAQWLTIDYPECVEKLILTVSAARPNPTMTGCISLWAQAARRGDHMWLMKDNLRKIYTPEYVRSNQWMIPLVAKVSKPKSYARFLTLADATLTHNAWDQLHRITAPTLIIGGEEDRVVTCEASREMAERIAGSQLRLYPGLGHSVYEEAKDFQPVVLDFLLQP